MKVQVWAFGAPSDPWVMEGEKVYLKRLQRYLPLEYKTVQVSKSKVPAQVLAAESNWLINEIDANPAKMILLDEKGKSFSSIRFSEKLGKWREGSHKRLLFIIGSAYGLDESLREKADEFLSLSAMTLPHQLCRLLLLEQIYRACTIWKGESYHH